MADTAVAITAGTGTNIDTRTEATNGNHRQVVVVGDPSTNAGVAPVDATAGLKVDLGADNDVTVTNATAANLKVDGSDVTQPVSGTVTANLGATDNAVLDAIQAAVQGTLTVGSHAVTNAGTFAVQVSSALPAGTNAIGKLAANSGVDIGDVDILSLPASTNTIEVVGDAAENALAAGNPLLTGGRYDLTPRTLGDGDVGALALDPDGALHVSDGGNTLTVDGTVTANLSSTDNTVLDNIDADTSAIQTAAEAIQASLETAGGQLVNLGSNNDVTVTGTVTANLGATDNAVLDTIASPVATVGTTPLQRVAIFDSSDSQITSFGGGTQYTEDAAAAANPTGTSPILVRADTPAGVTTTNGDNVAQRGTDYGAAYVQVVNSSGNFVDSFGGSGGTSSTDDAAFTVATDSGTPIMGIVTADLVDSGDAGAVAMSTDRRLHTDANLQQGNADVASGNPLEVTLANGSVPSHAVTNAGTFAVQVDSSSLPSGASTAANQSTIIGHVDGIETVLGTIDTDTGSIATSATTIAGAVSGTEMQVDVVGALPAGTNAIGKLAANSGVDIGDVDVTSTSIDGSINGAGAPTIDSYTTDDVNLAANTANQVVISAPGLSKQIWVYGLAGSVDVAGSISIQDEDDTALSGVMPVGATGGFVMNPTGNFAMPWIKVATNKALEIDTVTCTFDGVITYAIVSV